MHVTPRSLLGRLTITFAVISVAVTAMGAAMVLRQVRRAVDAMHEVYMQAVLDPLTERLRFAGTRSLQDPLPAQITARLDAVGGSVSYVVTDPQGRLLVASPRARRWLPRPGLGEGEEDDFFRIEEPGSRFWGIARQVETPEGPVSLQVGQDMTSPFVLLDDIPGATFTPILTLLGGGAMVLLMANLGLTRMLLRPLNVAAAQAAAIGPASSRRIEAADMPAEVLPLIRAVNGALDRLDEALGRQRRFSHDVAHELRTPLAILTTELDLMPDGTAMRRLRRDVDHLAEIVDQLLENAESRPASPEEEVDLVALCDEVVERLSAAAQRSGRSIALDRPPGPLWVRGDEGELRRAIRNLVDNALTHTPEGTAVLVRALAPATVEVADRGPGVPMAQRARVFERFWRADRTKRQGSGIGLSLVSEITARHGGTVTVRDQPGGGAVFAIDLPPLAGI
ncbi:HAMP domain-containing sensor histidine kinase [Roseomonas sp. CAU 1739]|uniref:sensor histidine kinase n=1 Tax=Roseomonas sp. CAU 1739 TaxID=3140364 RepID=UPI00325B17FA